MSNRKARGAGHERRAEILEAAERIFFAQGYEGATIRKIAEEVGVSPTALYIHFPDKRSMMMEIGVGALQEMIDIARDIAEGPGGPEEKIKQVLYAHIRYGLKRKTAYQLVFSDGAPDIAQDKGGARDRASEYYRILPELVAQLADRKTPRASTHGIAQTLWMGCHGLVTYLINNPWFGYVEVDELMELMVGGLVRGLFEPAKG